MCLCGANRHGTANTTTLLQNATHTRGGQRNTLVNMEGKGEMSKTNHIQPPSKRPRASQASPSPSSPQITTLTSWLEKGEQLLLLDLRPAADQRRRRLSRHPPAQPSLAIASLPLEEVKARSFELPARHVRFSILVASDDDDDGGDDNYTHVQTAKQFLLQPDRVASNKSRKFRPWNVQHILVANEAFWSEAKEMNLLEKERSENSSSSCKLPRLWDPDEMVGAVLLPLLQKEMKNGSPGGRQLYVYDMASGAGRDVAFLAEELLCSSGSDDGGQFHVTAIDHRYNAKQSNIVQNFFERRNVREVTSVVKANLSKWETMRKILVSARNANDDADETGDDDTSSHDIKTTNVLYCVRFLVRPLIRALASCSSLRAGAIFAISHFCVAEVGSVWPFDHPSPETVLKRDEMKELFAANGWDVVHDKIASDSDHGRTLLHFVAKKR